MLEGLINNADNVCMTEFNLNSHQIYIMSKTDDKNLSKYIEQYKETYNLSTVDVYVNVAMIHGQI